MLIVIGSICVVLILAIIIVFIMIQYRTHQARKRGPSSVIRQPTSARELYQVIRFGHASHNHTVNGDIKVARPDKVAPTPAVTAAVAGTPQLAQSAESSTVFPIQTVPQDPVKCYPCRAPGLRFTRTRLSYRQREGHLRSLMLFLSRVRSREDLRGRLRSGASVARARLPRNVPRYRVMISCTRP